MTTLMPDLQSALASAVQASEQAPRRAIPRWRVAAAITAGGVLAAGGATAAVIELWNPSGPELQGRTIAADPSPPPADQLELLGVLRRPADTQDRGARTLAALRYGPDRIRSNYVRLVARDDVGGGFALVPIQSRPSGGVGDADGGADLRDALCIVLPTDRGGGGTCQTTAQIANGDMLLVAAGKAYGVVPDGVTTVRSRDRNDMPQTVQVSDNAFVLPADGLRRPDIEWRDSTGAVVPHESKTTPPTDEVTP